MIQNVPLTLIDVGALGGIQGKWQNLKNIKFVGFEPDGRGDAASAAPGSQNDGQRKMWPVGVARETGTYPLYLTRVPCNSSLLKPNLETIRQLAYDESDFSIVDEIQVTCKSLDHICREGQLDPDVLKLDTQGSEHEILEGAGKALDHLFAVEIEVEFLPLYEKQKLFADVDSLMRSKGYMLMDLGNQLYVKGRYSQNFAIRKGYLVAADALYFKTPEKLLHMADSCSNEKLFSLLPICYTYGYLNFAFDVFSRLKRENPTRFGKFASDPLALIQKGIPSEKVFTISERKYSWVREFIEKRITLGNANWNYGLGNPTE
jgi:FkbM family methyltransferase